MRFKKTLITVAVLAGAALYAWWPGFEPDLSAPVNLHLKSTPSFGVDAGQGNIVGIEPVMEPLDYATAGRFRAKLAGYLDAAKDKGWLGPKTIVLLPEHIGTGLLAVDAGARSYITEGTMDAVLPLITANLFSFIKNMVIFDEQDAATAAFIRTRNREAADAQLTVYSSLARDYSVTIVAGSSAIMTPGAYPDSLSYGHGPIFNASFVFGPDGNPVIDATRKITLSPREEAVLTAGQARFLLPYNVEGRKVGVLLGADGASDVAIKALADEGAELVLIPSFSAFDDGGHSGQGRIPDLLRANGVRWAMKVCLKGALWGYVGLGKAWMLDDGTMRISETSEVGAAAIYNLWLK